MARQDGDSRNPSCRRPAGPAPTGYGTIVPADFTPAWWLPGPNAQTLWPALVRRARPVSLTRERLDLPDGDFVDIDWTGDSGPIVVILHGLQGSSRSLHVQGLLAALGRRGWRGAVMHFRGCSGEPNRLPRTYHSGETGDLGYFVRRLRERHPSTPVAAVGYSLGGNVLLKWLAERGAGRRALRGGRGIGPLPAGPGRGPARTRFLPGVQAPLHRRSPADRPREVPASAGAAGHRRGAPRVDVSWIRRSSHGAPARLPQRRALLPHGKLPAVPAQGVVCDADRPCARRSVHDPRRGPATRGARAVHPSGAERRGRARGVRGGARAVVGAILAGGANSALPRRAARCR